MPKPKSDRGLRRRAAAAAVAAIRLAWCFGCAKEEPTGLGSGLRTPPDSLRLVILRRVDTDSAFAVPVSLGRAPSWQLGRQFPQTAHLLCEFQIPTRVVDGADTLRLDEAHLSVKTDSLLTTPFTGSMRLRLLEVKPDSSRLWSTTAFVDSAILTLPATEPDLLARDTVLVGDEMRNRVTRL